MIVFCCKSNLYLSTKHQNPKTECTTNFAPLFTVKTLITSRLISKKQSKSVVHFYILSPVPPLPYRFTCHNLKHFIIREAVEGNGAAEVAGILTGNNRLVGTIDRLYPIKQIDRTGDDVSHLFRAVVTLWLNHIAGLAVQTHFGRLLCLQVCFFSLQ